MKNRTIALTTLLAALSTGMSGQDLSAHFDMTLNADGSITERVSGTPVDVASVLPALDVEALKGPALRFDGYSTYATATLPSTFNTEALTVSVVLAAETYPMLNAAEAETTPTYATVCGNLDETTKQGFALQLSSQGDLRFLFGSTYANGFVFTVNGSEKLECGRWNVVTAVLDKASNKATLYLNGSEIDACRMSRSAISHSSAAFRIGKDATDVLSDGFLLNTFCGLIDDIAIYNSALTASQVSALVPSDLASAQPDFAYPASRYAASLWRPQFHGMPTGGWTNECHGLVKYGDKYHVFFQKNANGPYMARLHWGHITSADLVNWTEEPIALRPAEDYDIKGCWSGCVFADDDLTGGKPNIIYTAVDNARAVIAQALPTDNGLVKWSKRSDNPIINGRPSGLSDDFRDPYFFSAGGNKYIIVGTSKDGIGACTLHKYENGTWSNDGKLFFQGTNANQHGTFWEMPNVTDMGNGRWLFTCTPLGLGAGVRTLYWTGTIAADGSFTPDTDTPQSLEMGGIGKEGYGLLSPSICQTDGKTILMGIVPDKLASSVNRQMGWAHNYSLPREISLAADGALIQKPFSGLDALRTDTKAELSGTLNGASSLAPVTDRQVELLGNFTVGSGSFGFRFLKEGDKAAVLTYEPTDGTLTLDISSLDRQVNDAGVYSGVYSATLPVKPAVGEQLTLHVYLDGSVADIFVNDRWAWSVRLFPTSVAAVKTETFATSPTEAIVQAWTLDPSQTAMGITRATYKDVQTASHLYDLQGRRMNCKPVQGLYIENGRKHYVH